MNYPEIPLISLANGRHLVGSTQLAVCWNRPLSLAISMQLSGDIKGDSYAFFRAIHLLTIRARKLWVVTMNPLPLSAAAATGIAFGEMRTLRAP